MKSLCISIMVMLIIVCVRCQVQIQAGLSQLAMKGLSSANFTIIYQRTITSNNYKTLNIDVGFVDNYRARDGIQLLSECAAGGKTQTSINCTITAKNQNVNNIVYLTYIVSDHGSLLIGSFEMPFSFDGNTSKSVLTNQIIAANSAFFNSTNAGLIQSMIFISGISSLDPDFSLAISSVSFNTANSSLQFGVSFTEVHIPTVKIRFGFAIYDPTHITINQFADQALLPGNVQSGMLYGIYKINRGGLGRPTSRLLQVTSLTKQDKDPKKTTATPRRTAVKLIHRCRLKIIIIYHKYFIKGTVNPSATAILIRGKDFKATQVKMKPIYVDPAIFNEYSQKDGIIDNTNPHFKKIILKEPFKAGVSNIKVIEATKSSNLTVPVEGGGSISSQAPPIAALLELPGQFNSLFSTNGFVILTSATDVDPIYYFQVNPVQQITNISNIPQIEKLVLVPSVMQKEKAPSVIEMEKIPSVERMEKAYAAKGQQSTKIDSTKSTSVYIQCIVARQKSIFKCQNGYLISRMAKVDYLQMTAKIECLKCQENEILNLAQRKCIVVAY